MKEYKDLTSKEKEVYDAANTIDFDAPYDTIAKIKNLLLEVKDE